ncbi:MAG: hypothetical protein IT480_06890 [Gammaproteobacteria bacterium]|nr:hypothetical protein [Gammaproteobacteria bacterium]
MKTALEPAARRVLALTLLAALLAGCSHLQASRLWPFHHKVAAAPEVVNELVAEAPEGVSLVSTRQYWDRNTLLVDLGAASGVGSVRLRPAAGTSWPVRLGFRVQSGSVGRLEVEGAQRVSYVVPSSGGPVVLRLDPGVYTARTAALTVAWYPVEASGG